MSRSLLIHKDAQSSWQKFTSDWYGHPARHAASFSLTLDQDILNYRFRAEKSAECDSSLQLGQFVEGLWENDVAELFVLAPDRRYQEFNLSPVGAWWCATFSDYRQCESPLPHLPIEIKAEQAEGYWSVSMTVRLGDLPVLNGLDPQLTQWNVCAILSPRQPQYLCWGSRQTGQPDFHLTENFLSPDFVNRSPGDILPSMDLPNTLPEKTREAYRGYLLQPSLTRELLIAKVRKYVDTLLSAHRDSQTVDAGTSGELGQGLLRLLRDCSDEALPHAQAAVYYFVESQDADPDIGSAHGFDDDAQVFNAVCHHLQLDYLKLG